MHTYGGPWLILYSLIWWTFVVSVQNLSPERFLSRSKALYVMVIHLCGEHTWSCWTWLSIASALTASQNFLCLIMLVLVMAVWVISNTILKCLLVIYKQFDLHMLGYLWVLAEWFTSNTLLKCLLVPLAVWFSWVFLATWVLVLAVWFT